MSNGMTLDDTDLDEAKQALRDVMTDAQAPAAARAAAARTMLELGGALGRHAAPPVDTSKPTSEMSRASLLAELAALEDPDAAQPRTE
ncbi:MAG: hypothetical protein J0I48_19040 [Devosia sp.]|uniref:hypothetical protein n=1 Tax=Devosia sp. 66-22 TaxID=1895753 RepID=UPI00092BD9E6|nr:hypothetical protein [Devosia sp. 66-22]MBN9348262.1 hypothetical protein [Devosia sp.]OJX48997.1 MAG: hypothetical protein BGO81_10405 [Devosia sp. 66-22]